MLLWLLTYGIVAALIAVYLWISTIAFMFAYSVTRSLWRFITRC